MTDLLLSTKLLIPPPRSNLVTRPHLIKRLQEGVTRKLTLISAPAGYGKTTLFGEWHAGPGRDACVAWLSLDSGDNDLARFLNYVVASTDMIQANLAGNTRMLLQSMQLPHIESLMTTLINDLSACKKDFILALDHYHVITTPEINDAVAFLLEHMPQKMHLVILTRSDPVISLARYRVNNQLTEIRAEHLRFTLNETTAFLKEVMGVNLTLEDTQTLMRRTEGWVAGLQLAALSIKGKENPSDIIATYGGGYYYIVDYLVEEVLNCQPASLQKFLLETSILDRLSGPLCDAVTGQTGGEAKLEQLERENLFVTQLGGECCWYRYHHLFADITNNLLRQKYPDQTHKLHLRAAHWYEQNNFIPEAINHALAAEAWDYAGALMEDYSTITWRSGEISRILEWVNKLPENMVFKYPKLSINYGWACVLTGKDEECEIACSQIERLITENTELYVDYLTLQVFIARSRGQQERAIELARKAQNLAESGNVETRALLMLSLSIALWDVGRVKESEEAAEEASLLAEEAKNWHAWAIMQAFLGLSQASYGNLRLAKEIYLRVIQERPGVPEWVGAGFVQVCLAALYYEWNELEKAIENALACLKYSEVTAHSEIQMNAYRQLAFIYQAKGDSHKAWETLKQAEKIIHEHSLPRLWGPEHVQIALAEKDLPAAIKWIQKVQGEYGAAIHYPAIPLERVKLALSQGDKSGATDLLNDSYAKAVESGNRYAQIEIRILQALASSDEDQAIDYLSEALEWGQSEGFMRIFVDQGEDLLPILRKVDHGGILTGYAKQLLSVMQKSVDPGSTVDKSLVDPLSERELEVLRLLAEGNSNQEIANELVIALGTVKRHIYNIFTKLDAKNRIDCVARAREMRLLE